ncbi:outer membrane beta-barrel protein [Acinetobacter qingfengensis]|uniref:Uncharacterized protein n=1 Tax=Acinetobacter qingfengensis TaxID=1262585 RepID=A0A1E7R4W2_9GAMM|nr:OmpW family outer membrane protein [Acinetobacter qingfengensis]KAA8732415.1 outer membrane beta-barrel protein [Acinetobacter qingfengensis]OEY94409.1 hypothetical protein BJI46_03450 [Acinetobacter qingfengensis]
MLKQIAIASLIAGVSSVALAGPWTVKVGGSVVQSTKTSQLAGGLEAKASTEAAFTPSIEYRFGQTPFSAELLLANPIEHDVNVKGLGTVATVKELPPTLTLKYNFNEYKGFTPYVGAGIIGFIPFDEENKGADVDLKGNVGGAAQVGFNFKPADAKNWGVYFDARYAYVDSKVKVNGVDAGHVVVNPMVYTLGYSYNF